MNNTDNIPTEANIASFLHAAIEPLRSSTTADVGALIHSDGTVQVTAWVGAVMLTGRAHTVAEAVEQVRTKLARLPRITALRAEIRQLEEVRA